ncbi:MAG: EAL domain-containing protein, partial [Rhodobacteraceae bacterium]|nr:EAL domain-containing protein [Paracoccaceae bacterium]
LRMIGASLGPLARLTKAARDFADGDLETRVKIESRNEFGTLGHAFNNMAGKMGRQIDMLETMSEIDHLILTGGSIDEVCGAVAQHLIRLSRSNAVAVVTGLDDQVSQAMMYTVCRDRVVNEMIDASALAAASGASLRVDSMTVSDSWLGQHAALFADAGDSHVAIVPVLLQRQLMGIILVGLQGDGALPAEQLQQCEDIAERFAVALASFKREEALFRQANYDDLTGLPNRQLLKDRLKDLVERPGGAGTSGALLYLDLDRFKEVNDVYGHSVGDMVLVQAAERIVSETRDDDIVARLGGDEFVVVMPKVSRSEVVKSTAVRLLSRLTDVFSVSGMDHFVGASIGIVLFPDDGESVETLLKNADAAMYRAKEAGRSRHEFFNHELNAEGRRKIELERELRTALARGDLELYYQPQFYTETGALSGAEALLRWHHDLLGDVSPAEFIPLAEESDLIVEIGEWVADRCARDLRALFDEGLHPGAIAINVSARQLRDERFGHSLFNVLSAHGIQPSNIRIEVTETAVAQNRDTAIEFLDDLRKKGVRIALDDFGTGYSSLSYLQNMPYDIIKIDKSFVDLIDTGETSANICRTVIRMAHELGKTSIAEGVESQSQLNFLRDSGCDVVQGYVHARPMSFDAFVAFVRKIDLHTHRRKALELV